MGCDEERNDSIAVSLILFAFRGLDESQAVEEQMVDGSSYYTLTCDLGFLK